MEVFPETDDYAPYTPWFQCPEGRHCTWKSLDLFLAHLQDQGFPEES